MALKEFNEQRVFQKLSTLCAKAEHCQNDMLEKMRQWDMDEEAQARVMERLISEHFVDDERFTRAFVHDKLTYNQWGRRKIEQALWLKHVDKNTVKEVLEEVDDEEYINVLKPLLKQKRKGITGRNGYECNMKLMKWAMSRGFTMDVICECMKRYDEELDEYNDF